MAKKKQKKLLTKSDLKRLRMREDKLVTAKEEVDAQHRNLKRVQKLIRKLPKLRAKLTKAHAKLALYKSAVIRDRKANSRAGFADEVFVGYVSFYDIPRYVTKRYDKAKDKYRKAEADKRAAEALEKSKKSEAVASNGCGASATN